MITESHVVNKEGMVNMDEEKYTEHMLEDGSLLVYLKQRFLSKKTAEQREWLFACIRDSNMIVPELPLSHKPDLLETEDGIKYLPIFSREEEMPGDYRDEFELISKNFEACCEQARSTEGLSGLVLDGFTDPMIIEFSMANVILNTPSRRYSKL